jgi:hypothetical protein
MEADQLMCGEMHFKRRTEAKNANANKGVENPKKLENIKVAIQTPKKDPQAATCGPR